MKFKLTKERIVRIGRDLANHLQVSKTEIIVTYKDGSTVIYDSKLDGDKKGNW